MMSSKTRGPRDARSLSKYKYSYNSRLYDLTLSNSSLDSKIGATRAKEPASTTLPEKIKSNANFSLERITKSSQSYIDRASPSKARKPSSNGKESLKFPQIRRILNPEDTTKQDKAPTTFYVSKVFRALRNRENTYMMNLARQHFIQTIEAIRIGKNLRTEKPAKQLKLTKRNPKFKTIFLDLDQTLIHCDQNSNNYSVKLNFPIEGGGTIAAGIRVRPFCQQFIKELSTFAEVIIFTASASSYADVVLDYLDPHKKYFAHRLYRQHCTLEKGFYTKDLRIVNRRLEDVAIVDNSGFTFMTQPQFGIPILPFYHFAKDKELNILLEFLRQLVKEADMRVKIQQTFVWEAYITSQKDPRTIFKEQYGIQ